MTDQGVLVEFAGPLSTPRSQCADVIIAEQDALDSAGAAAAGLLNRYPGCVVVAVRHVGGRWCLFGVRGWNLIVVSGDRALSRAEVSGLAAVLYRVWVEVTGAPREVGT